MFFFLFIYLFFQLQVEAEIVEEECGDRSPANSCKAPLHDSDSPCLSARPSKHVSAFVFTFIKSSVEIQ